MSKRFDKLSEHITREYEKKGFPHEKARKIGEATAGEIAHEKGK